MDKKFSKELLGILALALAASEMLTQTDPGKKDGNEAKKAYKNKLVVSSATAANEGFKKALKELNALAESVKLGNTPSGLHYDAVREELFSEACNSAELDLALLIMIDIGAVDFLEQMRRFLGFMISYTDDLKNAPIHSPYPQTSKGRVRPTRQPKKAEQHASAGSTK